MSGGRGERGEEEAQLNSAQFSSRTVLNLGHKRCTTGHTDTITKHFSWHTRSANLLPLFIIRTGGQKSERWLVDDQLERDGY